MKKNQNLKRKFPKEIYYDKSSLEQIKTSPDGKFVTFRLSDYQHKLLQTLKISLRMMVLHVKKSKSKKFQRKFQQT